MKRFWFSFADDNEIEIVDYVGWVSGAIDYAHGYADASNQVVYVNLGDDIVDVICPKGGVE